MASPVYFSPLRYPGGKGKMAEYLKAIVESNGLQGGCYVEPYAGGAAVAFELLLMDYVSQIYINDLDEAVHAFWVSVLEHTDELCDRIMSVPVDLVSWEAAKKVLADPKSGSTLDLGFATFFLNRCNRSGVITGGVIGGKKQTGRWKIDARFNRVDLVRRVEQIARFKSRISLSRLDAIEFMKGWIKRGHPRALVYLDPPYLVKGGGLYDSSYKLEDHAEVARFLSRQRDVNWIVSYDDEEAIKDLYRGFRFIRYSLSYSARDRYKGAEVMFFSDRLMIPDVPAGSPIGLLEAVGAGPAAA